MINVNPESIIKSIKATLETIESYVTQMTTYEFGRYEELKATDIVFSTIKDDKKKQMLLIGILNRAYELCQRIDNRLYRADVKAEAKERGLSIDVIENERAEARTNTPEYEARQARSEVFMAELERNKVEAEKRGVSLKVIFDEKKLKAKEVEETLNNSIQSAVKEFKVNTKKAKTKATQTKTQ